MKNTNRTISNLIEPQPVIEGAGVRLRRSIATRQMDYLDPFLLFDHFGSDNPDDYLAGFPMHPHRGIETVTYMLAGEVRHADSLGNSGTIYAGDVQWMTSGRGILHEEMPGSSNGKMEGFQLWVNLPARLKMSAPRYQEVLSNDIPEVVYGDGSKVRLIAGNYAGQHGPVSQIAIQPTYLDIHLAENSHFEIPTPAGHTVFSYIYQGEVSFKRDDGTDQAASATHLAVFSDGLQLQASTKHSGARFLLVMGAPLGEPIARYGPFVMNTREEIEQALRELRDGTFIKP